MGGCPGICRDPGPGNPRDWDRDRDSKPRESRERDKNLRDSRATKILRDNKSRHFGTSETETKNRGTVPSHPCFWLINYYYYCDYIISPNSKGPRRVDLHSTIAAGFAPEKDVNYLVHSTKHKKRPVFNRKQYLTWNKLLTLCKF